MVRSAASVLCFAVLTGSAAPGWSAAPESRRTTPLGEVRRLIRAGREEAAIAALGASRESYAAVPEDARAADYLLGKLLTRRGDPAGLTYLEALPAPFEQFDDRRLVWLFRARLLAGRDADALAAVEALLAGFPKADEVFEAKLARARLLRRLGRPEEAVAQARALRVHTVPRELRAEATRALHDWALADAPDEPGQAQGLARALLLQLPETDAARRPGLAVAVDDLTDSERFGRAKLLMDRWAYEEARDELRRLAKLPAFRRAASRRVGILSLYKIRDDAEEARGIFERLAHEGGPGAAEAQFRLLRALVKQDRYEEARAAADAYDKRYPTGKYREQTAYYRAWSYFDEHEDERALPLMDAYISGFGKRRSMMRGFKAWSLIRLKRWKQAIAAFQPLVSVGGAITRGRAWYWQAYALAQLGREDDARAKLQRLQADYPLTWYALLAAQLEATLDGRDPRASRLPWPEGGGHAAESFPLDEQAWDWPKPRPYVARRYTRVRRLVELSEPELARREYAPIRQAVELAVPAQDRLRFVHFVSHRLHDYKYAWAKVTGGSLSGMDGAPDAGDIRWLLNYPRAWAELVERLAARAGVSRHLVWGIMRQESRYQAAMVSSADAVGALQMIHPTAERVARDLGIAFDPETFPRPEVSFPYTFHYLAKHAALWSGQLVPTAASYNAGPAPVARWLRENPGAPLAFFVEEISYREARNYARMVAGHVLHYLYLYEPDAEVRGRILDALFPLTVTSNVPEEVGY